MIFDKTGSLASVKRHDYLPFGEELTTQGVRTPQLGYNADNVRQKFTRKERDNETGLDYFGARYYGSTQGRFTSADPAFIKSKHLANPQDLNRYAYVANNPLAFFDPDGLEKVRIIIQTFIPDQTVKAPSPGIVSPTMGGRTFEGDGRGVGEPGTYRTRQVIEIETDRSKNDNGRKILLSNDAKPGTTREIFPNGSTNTARADVKSDANATYTAVGQDFINVRATLAAANPLVAGSPPISYDANVEVFSHGTSGDLSVRATGDRTQFPGMEIFVERPETKNNSPQLVAGYNPNDNGKGPWDLFRKEHFEVDGKVVPAH